jgi:hypothetical protein
MSSSHLVRSDLIPVVGGYLILMIVLAVGLLLVRRWPPGAPQTRLESPRRVGWTALVAHLGGDVLGGYLLLMGIVLLYYYGVARVPGDFLTSAFSGSALLVGIAMPIALLLEWALGRWRRRRGSGGAG